MKKDYHKLDNPVWYSLLETQQKLSVSYDGIKFYHPDYCPFGGADNTKDISTYIDEYSLLTDNFFVVGDRPEISENLILNKELVCLQMVLTERIHVEPTIPVIALTGTHTQALLDLFNLVQPGYFKSKTAMLGSYFGVFKNGQLISVTGERMCMDEFAEVSAVVTHPEHTGQGYAKLLIAHTVNDIMDSGKMPYLHVAETNAGAIALYEKLGFRKRRKISFWNITK